MDTKPAPLSGGGKRAPAERIDLEVTQHSLFDEANQYDHNQTFKEAFRDEKGVLLWASVMGAAALSWGFDVQVNGAAISVEAFRRDFGYIYEGKAVLPANWQTIFNVTSAIGAFFGGLASGYIADKIGRKWCTWVGSWILCAGIALKVAATTRPLFAVANAILGVALGLYLSMAPVYCSEISPVVLRSITTCGVSLAIVVGQLLSNAVIKAFGERPERWAYRGPFCVHLHGTWYVRVILRELALLLFGILHGKERDIESRLAQVQETLRLESELYSNATWLDCFKGVGARRTMITLGAFCCQHLSGIIFVLGYSTYFFQLAGLPTSQTFSLGIGVTACGVAGNISSWWLVNTVGRRIVTFYGMAVLTGMLILIGVFDVIPTAAMGYVILGEASSPRLRSRTIGLTTVVQSLWGLIMNFALPYFVNPDEANLRGKVGFIFGGTSLLATIWVFFCVPEFKGLTFSEIDERFQMRVPARKFREYKGRLESDDQRNLPLFYPVII
ncbi:MFS general substrate transporter [Tuber magnatum]|uniref:MFS general substrate transporter n=1 Tax=Tuber magnatum TaxID=42249 RepID=A0A317SZ82_9PEZI|nr:MFS general substrate transporter [Tuber magnatum]